LRVIGIIGYKKSGKTTLVVQLAKELVERGYKIATIKHTEGMIDLADTDSAKHKKYAESVAVVSKSESAIFYKGEKTLEEMIQYLKADYLIVEGFKEERVFPRIVCLKSQKEQEALFVGLEIAVVGDEIEGLSVPVLKDIGDIADLAEAKAFKLPALNCGGCGFQSCYDLAREIVKGNRRVEDCIALEPEAIIKIDTKIIPLDPSTAKKVRNTIEELLATLNGYKKGSIEIRINQEGG